MWAKPAAAAGTAAGVPTGAVRLQGTYRSSCWAWNEQHLEVLLLFCVDGDGRLMLVVLGSGKGMNKVLKGRELHDGASASGPRF